MIYALRVNKQCKHFDKYHESWLFKLAIYSRFFNNHRQCQIVRFLIWEIEEEENAPWYQTWVKYLILCLGFKLCLFLNSKSVNWARIMPAEEGDHIFGSPANSPTEKKKNTSAAKQTNIFSFSLFLGRPVQWMENVIWQGIRSMTRFCSKIGWKWKWSEKCRKSEISLIWCISTTNNVKSCKKFNETAQTANFTYFLLTSCENRVYDIPSLSCKWRLSQ